MYYNPREIKQDQPKMEKTRVQNQIFETPFVEKNIEEVLLTGIIFPRDEDYGDFLFKHGEQKLSFVKQFQKQYRKQKKCFISRD